MPQETITLKLVAQDLASGNISKAVAGIDKLAQRGGIAGSVLQGVGLSFGMMLNPMNLVARGIGAINDTIGDSISAASDLQESQSKVNEVFDDSSDVVRDWASDLDSAYGISQQAALESAGTFGNFAQALGLTEIEALKVSTSLTELSGDLASFNNVASEDVLTALRAGLAGETEPMRRLGVDISAARVQALGLAEGIVGVNGKLTEAQKVQLRYKAIIEDTDKAQGDALRTADTYAGKQRRTAAEGADRMAELGQAIMPVADAMAQLTLDIIRLPDVVGDSADRLGDLITGTGMARSEAELAAREFGLETDAVLDMMLAIRRANREVETQAALLDLQNQAAALGAGAFDEWTEAERQWARENIAATDLVEEQVDALSEARTAALLVAAGNRVWEASTRAVTAILHESTDEVEDATSALQHFRENIDDFDDVRGIGAINDELREQRKLAREALEAGNAAKWARAQAAIESLQQEKAQNEQARAAMAEQKQRNQERISGIKAIASQSGESYKTVREELRKTAGKGQTLQERLEEVRAKLVEVDETNARPAIGMDLSEWNTRMAQWRADMAEIRTASGVTYDPLTGQVRQTAAASQKKMKQPHGGGFVRAGETAIIRQNEAVLTPASGTNIVPLDGPFAPKGGRGGGITNVFNFEGATFLASEQEARAWAAKITPHITREQQRLGVA